MVLLAHIVILTFLVVTAEDGSGQEGETQSELPVCTALKQGEDLSWTNLISDFYGHISNLTKTWNEGDAKVNDNIASFVTFQLAGMYSKLHSCMPEYLGSLPAKAQCDLECDYPIEDNMGEESIVQSPELDNNEKDREKDWINIIKKMIGNAKEKIKLGLEEWSVNDSFLLFCSIPGIINATVQVFRFCFNRKLKAFSRNIRRSN